MDGRRFKKWIRPEIRHNELTIHNWIVQYPEKLVLGYKTDIGMFVYMNAKEGIVIGDYTGIGAFSCLLSVSTMDNKKGTIVIGEGTNIGVHSVIMPNVTIGKNCKIGAFSFINRDVPDNTIGYGIPFKSNDERMNDICIG